MPRQSRIDTPGAVHHIIGRGMERRKIFRDNKDRNNFLERLGTIRIANHWLQATAEAASETHVGQA